MNHLFLRDTAVRTNFLACNISLDLSRQRLTKNDFDDLLSYAEKVGLQKRFKQMCNGEIVNLSENRAALHTSLRSFDASVPFFDEVNIERERMLFFADSLRQEGRITDVINIGIGGSEMGPRAVWHALQPLNPIVRIHFLSAVDGILLDRILSRCRPESTLVIISSKSFNTQETRVNAEAVDAWLAASGIVGEKRNAHIVTVSAKTNAAESLGLHAGNNFRIWPWVGGRFSLWGSIGLPLAIGLGSEVFQQLLLGAFKMDCHAKEAPMSENLPILMAVLAYWDITKLDIPSLCFLPYDCRLDVFPAWLQQLEMESLGKSTYSRDSRRVQTRTGQCVWGSNGNQGQHSFYQWLREGTWSTSIHMIKVTNVDHAHPRMAAVLDANADAQADALVMRPVGAPCNSLMLMTLKDLNPDTLGALLALYEHKTALLGFLLGINPFDQPGVELGKIMCQNRLGLIQGLRNKIFVR